MKLFDVVLHHLKSDQPWNPKPEESGLLFPRERVYITDSLWIGPISEPIAKQIFQTCRPGAYGFERRQLRCRPLYVYGRELQPNQASNRDAWDEDGRLQQLISISRLLHPTSAGLRTASRIQTDDSDGLTWISQARLEGVQGDAFVSPSNLRDWLSVTELMELKQIAWVVSGRKLSERVWRALWCHEYLSRSYEMDVRWPFAVTALEALLKVATEGLGRQFRNRSVALAAELGIKDYRMAQASEAWKRRSGLAHGQDLGQLSADDLKLYDVVEVLLREALLRALKDFELYKVFDDDAAIEKRWPI
jgi:hypothetical protein